MRFSKQFNCYSLIVSPIVSPIVSFIAALLLSVPSLVVAATLNNQQCFSHADNYYLQLYCQIKSEQPKANLPGFFDFKKNDEIVQALLIKPHARKLGLKVSVPRRSVETARSTSPRAMQSNQFAGPGAANVKTAKQRSANSGCSVVATELRCNSVVYQLAGNLANKYLDDAVFSADNKMALPELEAGASESEIGQYLYRSYERYIEKMLFLGLGGVTLSFDKFVFLFDDFQSKDVNFVHRFETMYFYLKQDKKTQWIETSISAPERLSPADCRAFNGFYACDYERRNFLYVRK